MAHSNPKAYLAGPDVFIQNADIVKVKKELCLEAGIQPLYPLDNEISGEDAAKEIFEANLSMIRECDFVLANTSPFRGPHLDPGTAYEIGYARALGKTVYLYSNDDRCLLDRIQGDFPELANEQHHVEDFGLGDNLMIAASDSRQFVRVKDPEDLAAIKAFSTLLLRLKGAKG